MLERQSFTPKLLLLFTVLPYQVLTATQSFACLLLFSLLSFFTIDFRRISLGKPLAIFCIISLLYVFFSKMILGEDPYFFSKANHFVQFAFLYFLFVNLGRDSGWVGLFASKKFFCLAAALLLLSIIASGGGLHGIDLTFMAVLISAFSLSQKMAWLSKCMFIGIIAVILFYCLSRVSSFVILTSWVLLTLKPSIADYFQRWHVYLIVLLPICVGLILPDSVLSFLYLIDPNTAIRIEFLHGAAGLILDAPFLGQGFDAPYRDPAADYLVPHALLVEQQAVNVVSNHNSVLDVALRLGLPTTALFLVGLFNLNLKHGAYVHAPLAVFLMISMAIGLSVDAWMENQMQLPVLCMCAALLFLLTRKIGRV